MPEANLGVSGFISQYAVPFLVVLLALNISILVHEIGHFVVARLFGVVPEILSVGFGKRLWGFSWHGTDFRISAVPFGGYVWISGYLTEDTGSKKAAELPEGIPFCKRGWFPRVAVAAGGSVFTFLFAVLTFGLVAVAGIEYETSYPSVVGDVKEGTAVYDAGLRKRDRIVEVAGNPVSRWAMVVPGDPPGILDVLLRETKQHNTSPIQFIVERREGDRTTSCSLVLPAAREILEACQTQALGPLIAPAYIGDVMPDGPAALAGIRRGDIVTGIDGQPCEDFGQLVEIVSRSAGKRLRFAIKRGNETKEISIIPTSSPANPGSGRIGVASGSPKRILIRQNPLAALKYGFATAVSFTKRATRSMIQLFVDFRFADGLGPIGIIDLSMQRVREGWKDFLLFFGILNLVVMVFNLLPIPVLDGGYILVVTAEAAIRRPIPRRMLRIAYWFCFILLIVLLSVTAFLDILRLFY